MKFIYDVPVEFWGLFRSQNRDIYIEALLSINDEYQYNNYYLSKEACVQILGEMCQARCYELQREEDEAEEEENISLQRRILNWLIEHKWLRRVEDHTSMTTNVVIPDYAAVMIEAFEQLVSQPMDDTEIYIQNVYATLFSFKRDNRLNVSMLKTALVNTKKLNKVLQDMLHNMDRFFERLLEQKSYKTLLKEHLEGYVEEVVKQKYHILKTSDNFYIYKTDIKNCLREMREDEAWIERVRAKQKAEEGSMKHTVNTGSSFLKHERSEDVLDLIDQIERGFDDIEHRISNMDREHSKYVRATVSRLNYLLSDETQRHGMLVQLLNHLSAEQDLSEQEEKLARTAQYMNLSAISILKENALYKRRKRKSFEEALTENDTENEELSKADILRLNKIQHRFTRKQIETFIEEHMEGTILEAADITLADDEDFEKLILAYDISMRKNSKYEVIVEDEKVHNGIYHYPKMTFMLRRKE